MELLGERPVWSMSGSEMLSTLDALDAELARQQTYRLHVIAALEEIGYAKEIGAHDTARLLSFRHRIDSAEAHRDVRLARSLPKYTTVSAALPDPTRDPDPAAVLDSTDPEVASESAARRPLRPAQAQAIVWALDRVAARVAPDNLAVAEEQLVGLAAHLSPGQLRKAGREIGDLLDSDGPEPDEHKAYTREFLTLASGENGVKFRGFLANENAELFRSLIHSGARPHKTADGELDPRSREKRQADALSATLTVAAAATDTGHISTTIANRTPSAAGHTSSARADRSSSAGADGTSTLTGSARAAATSTTSSRATASPATSAADARATDAGAIPPATPVSPDAHLGVTASPASMTPNDTARTVGGWVPGFGAKANITVTIDLNDLKAATADAIGQVVYGDALSAAAIRRLACDAKIIPLVLGSNSEPLDVGRSERLVNRAMRRALNARDKGCVVCGAPPIHCDAHHVRSWIDGGPTAVDNLVLLCRRHHIDLHAGHWTITITNGTVQVTRPTWATPPPPTPHRPPPASPPATSPAAGECAVTSPRPTSGHVVPADPPANSPTSEGRAHARPVNAPPQGGASSDEAAGTSSPAEPRRHSKWKADEALLREAARFAVWGNDSMCHAAGESAATGRAQQSCP